MVHFSYFKRTTSLNSLRRLLLHQRSCSPEIMKFTALRALKCEEIANEEKGRDLANLIQERLENTHHSQWKPCEIVSVLLFLEKVGIRPTGATNGILSAKVSDLNSFDLLDLSQVLKCVKKLRLRVNVAEIAAHFESNVIELLKNASLKNVHSILNGFSNCGVKLSQEVIERILAFFSGVASDASFRDLSNFVNAVLRHVDSPNFCSIEQEIWEFLKKCKELVKEGKADLEGSLDIVDAIKISSQGLSMDITKRTEIVETVDFFYDFIESELGKEDNCEPRLLKIAIRTLRFFGMYRAAVSMILGRYSQSPESWSVRGNSDILASLAFFEVPEVPFENFMILLDRYRARVSHVKVDDIFIELCILYTKLSEKRKIRKIIEDFILIPGFLQEVALDTMAAALLVLSVEGDFSGFSLESLRIIPQEISKRVKVKVKVVIFREFELTHSAIDIIVRNSLEKSPMFCNDFRETFKIITEQTLR